MAIKNPIIKAQFTKFIENESLSGYGNDTLFEIFSIFCIEQGLLNKNFDYADIHFQGSEFGIDGAAVIVNNEIVTDKSQLSELLPLRTVEFHFCQSKSGEKLKTGDLGNFFSAIEDFFDEDYQSDSDDLNSLHSIKEYIYANSADLTEAPSLRAFFVYTGKYTEPKEVVKSIGRTIKKLEPTSCLLYTSPSPRDQRGSRMPSSA